LNGEEKCGQFLMIYQMVWVFTRSFPKKYLIANRINFFLFFDWPKHNLIIVLMIFFTEILLNLQGLSVKLEIYSINKNMFEIDFLIQVNIRYHEKWEQTF
jgi:hypothetical protein